MSRWSVLLGATAAVAIASISTTGCKNGGGADNLGIFIPPATLSAISSVIPNAGSVLGGNSITIIGSNFATGATAKVGNTDLTNIAQPNTFTITGTIPAGTYTAGAVDVSVITSSQTAVLKAGYTFEDMTFTSITPNNGPITGQVPVVIRGTNFKDVPLDGVVLSGQNGTIIGTLTNVVVNETFDQINAVVPPGLPLGPYSLIITSSSHGVKNFGQVYTVGTGQSTTMLITDIRSQPGNQSPAHGPLAGGTTVTLTADLTAPAPAGFQGGINVTLIYPDGSVLSAGSINVSANFGTLTFTTPVAPGSFFGGPVTIRVDSATQGFATAQNGFTYDAANATPAINSISPAIGPQGGGTLVTMLGVNFKSGAISNVRRVLVGGVPAPGVAIQSTNQLQFTTPPGTAGQQPVLVESTTGVASNSVNFTYQPSIVITKLTPNNGPLAGGTSITITGANFTTATIVSGSVTIDGAAVTNITFISSSTATGITPAGKREGPVDVVVASNGGLPGMVLDNGYTYGPQFDSPINVGDGGFDATSLKCPQGTATAMVRITTQDALVTVNNTDNSLTFVPSIADLNSNSVNTTVRVPNGDARFGGASPLNNPIDIKTIENLTAAGSHDVIVLNNGTGAAGGQSISVLRSTGAGNFAVVVNQTPTNALPSFATLNAVSIDVADVNSDGHPDVAVLGASATLQNGVGVFFGQAGGTLTVGATFNPIGTAERGAVKLRIIGQGGGFLGNPFSGTPPADMNSDGLPDLITLSKTTGSVSVLLGDGTGKFTLATTTSVGATNPTSFDVADVDQSGTLDVVTANDGNGTNGSISVLVGNGASALALFATYSVPGFQAADFVSLVVGDVNNDCRPDVTVANYSGSNMTLFLGNGDASFSTPVQYNTERPDLAATAHVVQVLGILASNNTFSEIVTLDQQTNGGGGTNSFVTVVPVHIIDAYVGDYQPTPPNPIFQATTQGIQPQAVAYGDLNGDGRLDMVLCNRTSNNVQVFIGDGTGNFTQPFAPIPLNAGAQPEGIRIARVDNTSGAPSVLVACNGLNAVALLRNFGGGSLSNPVYISLDGTGPHQVLVDDLNGDGKADIITVNQVSNNVSILLGDGTGGFTRATSSPYAVGNGPLEGAIDDLDGNGTKDLAVCNFASSDVTLLLTATTSATNIQFSTSALPLGGTIATNFLVSAGGLGPQTVTRGQTDPRSIAIGDLNGDGAKDIVTADSRTGTITILYGKMHARITLDNALAVVNVGSILQGPGKGVAQGNTLDASAPPYTMRVTAVLGGNTFDVEDITGGGRVLKGDLNQNGALDPNLPGALFNNDPISVQTGVGTSSVVGNLTTVGNVGATGHFFLPTDYLSDGGTTNIGNPSVIMSVGTNPSVVRIFDLNSDGFSDILVGVEDGSQLVDLISMGEAAKRVFKTKGGVYQTIFNVPSFGTLQDDVNGIVTGGPNFTVSPAGEFTIKAPDKLVWGLPDSPATPHNGYPIFIATSPVVAAGSDAKFTQTTSGRVLGLDVGHVTLDCPPSVAVTTDDNKITVYKLR